MDGVGLETFHVPLRVMESASNADEFDLPPCLICSGKLEVVYNRYHQKVAVCADCHTGVTVPGSAWTVARLKREGQWNKKTG